MAQKILVVINFDRGEFVEREWNGDKTKQGYLKATNNEKYNSEFCFIDTPETRQKILDHAILVSEC